MPTLGILPPFLWPDPVLLDAQSPGRLSVPLRSQADSDPTCVGQALATLIDIQRRLQAVGAGERVSARMLYDMARYHELDPPLDGVRRLRSAIKAFYHHGACLSAGGDGEDMQGYWPDDGPVTQEVVWPTAAQARSAERRALGAYFRVRPILNHYHSAVRESHAVLVSAEIHDGWRHPDGGKIDAAAGRDKTLGTHAFLIIGYTEEGFLVLNSWGEGWGGYPIAVAGARHPAPGIALWCYDDWARSVRDGWVLRLGVPGREAFSVSAGEQGLAHDMLDPNRPPLSTPSRELRGHFLNLEDGLCTEWGAYATPEAGLGGLCEHIVAAIASADYTGVVVRIPGILEPLETAFTRAVRQKDAMARHGLFYFTCFWCAEFATEVNRILADIFQRCASQGAKGDELDLLFEASARSAGRAFWRDIERHARSAVLKCDPSLAACPGGSCDLQARRGKLGEVFDRIVGTCKSAGKPLHLVADGAGALVIDALVGRRCENSDIGNLSGWFPVLRSLALTLPAVPMDRAHRTVLPLAEQLAARYPTGPDGASAALIIVPDREVEARISLHGYGKSVLELVRLSFLDPNDAFPPQMLGGSCMARLDADGKPTPPFAVLEIDARPGIEQVELARHPELERLVEKHIRSNHQPSEPAVRPPPVQPEPSAPLSSASTAPARSPSPERHTMSKIDLAELQRRIADGSLTAETAARYLFVDVEASAPFTPVIRVNPETVAMPEDEVRSALALNALNFAARLSRKAQFYRKLSEGYSGPRIAAEGDSWFQYSVLLQDVIDRVADEFAVFCTSAAGDLLENMAREREYIHALRESGAEILLLSAGGNDLCAGGALATHLERFRPDLKPGDYLKRSYQDLLDSSMAWYERICRDVHGSFPNVTIICHGYDHAIPDGGRWLGKPMESQGITDPALQRAIAAEMVDQFNRTLRRMAETMPHVIYVDCRGAVPAGGWNDELHPKDPGYGIVAERIIAKIRELTGTRDARGAAHAAPAIVGPETRAWSLHVGLNSVDPQHYAGWSGELRGCENDARAMRDLTAAEGFRPTLLLTSDATREAVTGEIRRAAAMLGKGDHFVFSISSHGSQVPDFNGDEPKSEGVRQPDSTLCLYDAQLIDDEIFDLWSKFQAGVRILMIADCCHSGTIAKVAAPALLATTSVADLQAASLQPVVELWPRTMPAAKAAEVIEQNEGQLRETAGQFRHVNEQLLMSPILTPLKASVLQISACQDEQVAYDGAANGVFTGALLRVWDRGAFRNDHYTFHRRIAEMVSARQLPNLFQLPPVDHAFGRQRPFTVRGGAGREERQPVPRPGEMATRVPIGVLLVGEGDENDVPEPVGGAFRALPREVPDAAVLARFDEFLRPENLRFFKPEEFLFLGNSHYAPGPAHKLNSLPPEELWPNIRTTAKVLDELRARLGVPVRILSAYRNDAYNRAIGGEENSMHKKFLACDIAADGVTPRRVADTLARMREEGLFKGGIGRYGTFTHVDSRGTSANWGRNGGSRGVAHRPPYRSAERPEQAALGELAKPDFRLPRGLLRRRGSERATDLAEASAAVNGPAVMTFVPQLSPEMRRAVLYSTQFAQRAADARVDAVRDRIAWWGVYTAALGAIGWVTTAETLRQSQTSNLSGSIDRLALDAIAGFVGANKLQAIHSVLEALRRAPDGDARLALLDLFASEGRGGLFQLGAADTSGEGKVTLALGAVHFENTDERKRLVFFEWGEQQAAFWVAAAQMMLNLDFYRDVARSIVEGKLSDGENLIAAFAVDKLAR